VLRNSPSIEASPYRVVFSLPDTYPLPRSSTYVGADDPITIPVLLDRTDAFGVQRTGSGPSGGVVNMTGTIEIHGSSVPHAWETYFADTDAFEPAFTSPSSSDSYTADTDGDGKVDVVGASFETERLFVSSVEVGVGINKER